MVSQTLLVQDIICAIQKMILMNLKKMWTKCMKIKFIDICSKPHNLFIHQCIFQPIVELRRPLP